MDITGMVKNSTSSFNKPNEYPEHEKLASIGLPVKAVQQFVLFLESIGISLATDCPDDETQVHILADEAWQEIIATFFGIDFQKFNEEKAAMLMEAAGQDLTGKEILH